MNMWHDKEEEEEESEAQQQQQKNLYLIVHMGIKINRWQIELVEAKVSF